MFRTLLCGPLALLLLTGCNTGPNKPEPAAGGKVMQITSSAFSDGQPIPTTYAAGGDNLSPPLQWSGAPDGVQSFALICDDPDAPGKTWVHWVIWNVPADTHEFGEGKPTDASMRDGTRQGKNDSGGVGYSGPAPPPGKPHHYYFKLYALDTKLELPEASTTKQDLEGAMQDHILAHAQIIGAYQK